MLGEIEGTCITRAKSLSSEKREGEGSSSVNTSSSSLVLVPRILFPNRTKEIKNRLCQYSVISLVGIQNIQVEWSSFSAMHGSLVTSSLIRETTENDVGQIFECSLGLAGSLLDRHYRIAPFDERYEQEVQERESYDMLGISYENHPRLKRILMPESWIRWPLRKDYIAPNFYELQDAH